MALRRSAALTSHYSPITAHYSRDIFSDDWREPALGGRRNHTSIRNDCVGESPAAFATALIADRANRLPDGALHVLGVLAEVPDNLFKRDRVVLRVPAIVIRNHGERGVAQLGFAREFGFRKIRHADHVEPKLAICVRFSQRREL